MFRRNYPIEGCARAIFFSCLFLKAKKSIHFAVSIHFYNVVLPWISSSNSLTELIRNAFFSLLFQKLSNQWVQVFDSSRKTIKVGLSKVIHYTKEWESVYMMWAMINCTWWMCCIYLKCVSQLITWRLDDDWLSFLYSVKWWFVCKQFSTQFISFH